MIPRTREPDHLPLLHFGLDVHLEFNWLPKLPYLTVRIYTRHTCRMRSYQPKQYAFIYRIQKIFTSCDHLCVFAHLMELLLRHTFTHRTSTAHTTLHHLQQLVDVIGSRPFLVLDHVDAAVHLGLLHQLAIGTHALPAVRLGEGVRDQGRRVQTSKRDKLPAVSQFAETLNVRLLLRARHGSFPVERWRKVVSEPVVELARCIEL